MSQSPFGGHLTPQEHRVSLAARLGGVKVTDSMALTQGRPPASHDLLLAEAAASRKPGLIGPTCITPTL